MADVLGAGFHDNIAEDRYHRDPCAAPSLSSSIARVLVDQSPRHAWQAHPRLNSAYKSEQSTTFDMGTAAHALLLEGSEARLVPIDAKDFKTAAAQAQRDEAYAAGKTPLLVSKLDDVRAMAAAARAQLARHEEASDAFDRRLGKPEQTGIWQDGDIWCRMRIDWRPSGGNVVYDYKTTTDANPENWVGRAYNLGHHIQAAFYRRGLRALTDKHEWHFRWIVQETTAPYALSVCELDPASLAMADRQVDYAVDRWRWCMKTGRWGGYDKRVHYLTAPVWEERTWTEREERVRNMADAGEDERAFLLDWQAPLGGKK